jgi:hypothetical protein
MDFRPPYKGAPSASDPRVEFRCPATFQVFESLGPLFDAKRRITPEAIGYFSHYLLDNIPGVKGSRHGVLFDAVKFIGFSARNRTMIKAVECLWTTPGSLEVLGDFVRMNDPARPHFCSDPWVQAMDACCNRLQVECVPCSTNDVRDKNPPNDHVSAFLGMGGFGRVFRVRERCINLRNEVGCGSHG